MTTCRFGISNKPFHFLIHCLCDATFQYTNIKPEGAGRVTVFPPLRHVDEIAERLHHTPDCTYSALMTVDEIGIADNGAFCRFRPLFIPPVDRKRPRQPRQQICRTGIRVPQFTNPDRRFSISAQALRQQLQAVMSRSAAVANHSSEPPVTTRYSVQKDACVLLSTMSASGAVSSTRCTPSTCKAA